MGFKFDPCAQFHQGSECEERLESNRTQVGPTELTTFELYIYMWYDIVYFTLNRLMAIS